MSLLAIQTLWKRWPPAAYALMDQAVVSGASFLTMICVARWLSAEAYGVYALLFGVCLLIASIQRAWVTQPLDVLGPAEPLDALLRRRAAATRLTDLSALMGSAVIAAVVLWMSQGVLTWLAATAYLLVFFRHELVRRLFYTTGLTRLAVAPSVVAYGLGLAAVLVLAGSGVAGNAPAALGVAALGLGAGLLTALALATRQLGTAPTASWLSVRSFALEHFRFARWLIVTQVIVFASTELYVYYVFVELSAAEAGTFRAAIAIVNVFNIIRMTLVNYLPRPMSLAQAETGADGLFRKTGQAWLVALLGGIAIAALVTLSSSWIETTVYSSKYVGVAGLIVWMAWLQPLSLVGAVSSVAASVLGQHRHVFISHAAGGTLSVLLGWWLVREHGLQGGLIGLSIGLLIPAILQTALLVASLRKGRA